MRSNVHFKHACIGMSDCCQPAHWYKPFLVLKYDWNRIHIVDLPYYRKLTLHEINVHVLEINAS